MFDADDLAYLAPKYFTIIYTDVYDVAIRSKNTGHYWSLHSPAYSEKGFVAIFHSHHAEPYHAHGWASSLRQAVRSIRSHDRWQIEGRPRKCL